MQSVSRYRRTLSAYFIAFAVLTSGFGCSSHSPRTHSARNRKEYVQFGAQRWDEVLNQTFKVGQDSDDIEKFMAGKFRDRGKNYGMGRGGFFLIYLLDDYHQITFAFDREDKLIAIPSVVPRKQWLRFPGGEVGDL